MIIPFIVGLLVGLFLGVNAAILVLGLCIVAGEADHDFQETQS